RSQRPQLAVPCVPSVDANATMSVFHSRGGSPADLAGWRPSWPSARSAIEGSAVALSHSDGPWDTLGPSGDSASDPFTRTRSVLLDRSSFCAEVILREGPTPPRRA